MMTGMSRR